MNIVDNIANNVGFNISKEAKEKVAREIATTDEWIDLNNRIIKMLYVYSGHED